jgi:pimeloyl-ACP methyl ester carboxylesterase
MAYAVRHPGHAGALVLQSTNARVDCPTLVGVGELDPVTPVAAAREIVDALPRGSARLEVTEGAGHFTWKDAPDRYWPPCSSS